MPSEQEKELQEAINRVIRSVSRKKLIVAGPGTGKTALFRRLLESAAGDKEKRLVLTFINNLKSDLEEDLSDLAKVYTLHGYCQLLLHQRSALRGGLSSAFRCLPGLASLIKRDWEILEKSVPPSFVDDMRDLRETEELGFYLSRGDFYDAVDFDDSVYRTYKVFKDAPDLVEEYDLVLVDEYQDFNRMEGKFISLLARKSPIVVAGDDDQALYSQLRGSTWDLIRALHGGGEYDIFELPYCMRCPEVVVGAVNDVIGKARESRKLAGRIEKPFRHYEPVKGEDSRHYPNIVLMHSTVQRLNANYFGRFIEQAIGSIPENELREAAEKRDPLVLVIGIKPYLRQIDNYLTSQGFTVDKKRDAQAGYDLEVGLGILRENDRSNLGWRVILEFENAKLRSSTIIESARRKSPIYDVLPEEFREEVLRKARGLPVETDQPNAPPIVERTPDVRGLPIKLTSFEGAKGLSAHHVFIVGMHENEIPRDRNDIQDIEICRFVVGLTRTRKQCTLMHTSRFADEWKHPSLFLSWIRNARYQRVEVNAVYWNTRDT